MIDTMEVKIKVSQLKTTLKNIEDIRDRDSQLQIYRSAGFLEGILYTLGEINPSDDFIFKDIQYIKTGYFGGKKIKTRKQTYIELMIEKVESLITKENRK